MKSSSNIIQSMPSLLKKSGEQIHDNSPGHNRAFENSTTSKQKSVSGKIILSPAITDLIDVRVKADEDRPE